MPPIKLPVLLSLRRVLADIGLAPPTCGTARPDDSRLVKAGRGCSRPRFGMSIFVEAGAPCSAEVRFEPWFRGDAEDSREGVMMSIGGDCTTIVRSGRRGVYGKSGVRNRERPLTQLQERVTLRVELVASIIRYVDMRRKYCGNVGSWNMRPRMLWICGVDLACLMALGVLGERGWRGAGGLRMRLRTSVATTGACMCGLEDTSQIEVG